MLTVEAATVEDLEALAEPLAGLPLFVPYGFTAPTLRDRWVLAHGHGEGFLVAREADARLGLAWFLPAGTFGSGAYLRTLALVPGSQGRGVGQALLEGFEQKSARALGGFFLLASDFNPRAHRFYERHGYQEVGRLPGFAAAAVSEVIFWKRSPLQPA